ncbi:hypothetical protein LCGC14_1427200 [marine sediment metagenome]|uniref:Uncharacterized protein n=1 Tax=marine sediment metagenome TaxID=412755 RepID=A0A0F9JPN2_9ZZZZ
MKKTRNKTKTNILRATLFGLIIFGMLVTVVIASPTYQLTLAKGTDVLTVNQYDDADWKSTVNASTNPSFWFEGDTNIAGAKSKTTILGWNDIAWQTWDAFISLFMSEYFSFEDLIIILNIMDNIGYNETTINANYTDSYNLWYGVRAVWNFTDGAYLEQPSYTEDILVFKDPLDFKTILDDYNTIAAELSGFIQLAGFNFPNLTADDFLWHFALNGFAVASPRPAYLTELINELGCVNVSASGSTLVFERSGETNYVVEITYGKEGTISSFTVKDVGESVIFQIISTNSEWIFYLILVILVACGAGLVAFIVITRRKPKK